MTTGTVRKAAMAGRFYPADAEAIRLELGAYLAAASPEPGKGLLKALVVPHAGTVYSGPVAAWAYKLLAERKEVVRHVMLLGPSHRSDFDGICAPAASRFATPLGEVPVERPPLGGLLVSDAPHHSEHCLEVQLPFLQMVLKKPWWVAPLLVGQMKPEELAADLEELWGGPETLFLISTDLSHYLPYGLALSSDETTARAVERLDAAAIDAESACGAVPLRGFLTAAKSKGLKPRRLCLANSGDSAGGRDEVVGYGAWAFEV